MMVGKEEVEGISCRKLNALLYKYLAVCNWTRAKRRLIPVGPWARVSLSFLPPSPSHK